MGNTPNLYYKKNLTKKVGSKTIAKSLQNKLKESALIKYGIRDQHKMHIARNNAMSKLGIVTIKLPKDNLNDSNQICLASDSLKRLNMHTKSPSLTEKPNLKKWNVNT